MRPRPAPTPARATVAVIFLLASSACAQDTIPPLRLPDLFPDTLLVVDEVIVTGNEKTKPFVILREMSLRPGEQVTRERIEYDRERIYSLRLFNRVQVRALPSSPGKATVLVELDERWYIFPFPILGLRDRDWSKIFYGAGVVHNNFRGRNEKLFASLTLGYDPSVTLAYRNPFLDEDGTWFMDARASYNRIRNRSPGIEAVYGEYEERHFSAMANFGTRIGRHHSVWLSGGYKLVHAPSDSVVTTISEDGRDHFPVLGAGYLYDTRDLLEYPSHGTMASATFLKSGVPGYDVDYFRFAADVRHFVLLPGGLTLGGRLYTDLGGGGTIPVYGRVYIGYGERVRGHFDEVVEGENIAGGIAELHVPLLPVRYLRMEFLPDGFDLWRFGATAALFGDAGTAWFGSDKFSVGQPREGVRGRHPPAAPLQRGAEDRVRVERNPRGRAHHRPGGGAVSADFFYCPPERIAGGTLVIDGDEFSHLVHVMRRKEGDGIVAVDGRGNAYEAVIERIDRRPQGVSAGYPSKQEQFREPGLLVTLAAAVLKNPSRYDFLVEKSTELGVTEIVPMRTARTIPSHARSDRWRKLALAAMKQSGRSWLPAVRDLTPFGDVVEEFRSFGNRVVAHEDPSAGTPFGGLRPGAPGENRLVVLVGPEGGFTPEEIAECVTAGFGTFWLGERRLRTETAAVVALARLMS